MDSPKTLQQHIQTLPLELKILVIHWTVQVSKTIQSSRRGPGPSLTVLRHGNIPVLLDAEKANPISGRLGLFSTDAELAKIAFEEFWKVNVFQVYSSHWFGHTASLFPQHLGLLLDETSRRQYIQHLVLYVDEDNHYNRMEGGIKDWISINEVNILWQLAGACPKLQSLMVEINYTINEDCPSWWQDPEPYYAIAWEREHYLRNVIRTVRELPGIKSKSLSYQIYNLVIPECLGHPVEIDGRGCELGQLVWEILEWPAAIVRLS